MIELLSELFAIDFGKEGTSQSCSNCGKRTQNGNNLSTYTGKTSPSPSPRPRAKLQLSSFGKETDEKRNFFPTLGTRRRVTFSACRHGSEKSSVEDKQLIANIGSGCATKLHGLEEKPEVDAPLSSFLKALRPRSFRASLMPSLLATVLAYKATGSFSLVIFGASCLTVLAIHAAGNLINTYFDFSLGIDGQFSDDRTLVDNILSPTQVSNLALSCYCIGLCSYFLVCFMSPSPSEHLALVFFMGLSASLLYTSGNYGLKYHGLGDLVVIISFGPVCFLFSWLAQGGPLSLSTVPYILPLVLLTEGSLHANNVRDLEADKKAGILTLAMILGPLGSYLLFVALLFVPYFFALFATLHLSPYFALPLLTIKVALRREREYRLRRGDEKGKATKELPQKMTDLNTVFGLLYVCSVLLT